MMMLEPSAPRIPAGSGASLPALRFTRPQSCVSRADATSWQMKGAKLTTAVIPLPSPPATAADAWLTQAAEAGRGLACWLSRTEAKVRDRQHATVHTMTVVVEPACAARICRAAPVGGFGVPQNVADVQPAVILYRGFVGHARARYDPAI